MRATCLIHIILLKLKTIIIFGEEHKLRIYSLYNCLKPPVASTILGTKVLLSFLFSKTLSLCYFHGTGDQISHSCKQLAKLRY
jgi:hypothetical protein